VTQFGEGQDPPGAASAVPQVLTFGTPAVGEILAERYQLEEHIGNDSLGRQLWRGIDVILRRPIAVVLRYPGGDSAGEMLSAAVAASRIVHPHLAGVYDAIDEGDRAYVVREWVNGASLREVLAGGPLDADRSVSIAQAVTAAVAALHATGMAHGNVHPGTVLIGGDGRVVLTDARTDVASTPESDVRAIGAVLYSTLTAHWPHAEAGVTGVPDAIRDSAGKPAAIRQIRSGIPAQLDELTMDLLNLELAVPAIDVLAAELDRFEPDPSRGYGERSGLDFDSFSTAVEASEPPRRAGRKIAVGVVGLLVIAAAGMIAATKVLSPSEAGTTPPARAGSGSTSVSAPGAAGNPTPVKLSGSQLRVVDSPGGDRKELDNVDKTVDGNLSTGWKTNHYNSPAFGNLPDKTGMGILIDLGSAKQVASVRVQMARPGATIEIRTGNEDPGNSTAGDTKIINEYQHVGDPLANCPTNPLLPVDQSVRYLLVWVTVLPPADGRYQVAIQELTVYAR
jgi:hypothetical protein